MLVRLLQEGDDPPFVNHRCACLMLFRAACAWLVVREIVVTSAYSDRLAV